MFLQSLVSSVEEILTLVFQQQLATKITLSSSTNVCPFQACRGYGYPWISGVTIISGTPANIRYGPRPNLILRYGDTGLNVYVRYCFQRILYIHRNSVRPSVRLSVTRVDQS